jgi:DNA polymerase III epsilon subunit-like protein
MIVVDVEMSGVNPEKNSIVSIGAVDFEMPERRFYEECRVWDGAHISEEALAVNGYTEEELLDTAKQSPEELIKKFIEWAQDCKEHTLMGQNPGTDLWFMENTANRFHIEWPFAHRSLDLHTVCAMHMIKQGIELPVSNKRSNINSDFVMKYVGIPEEPKPHIAINGAIYEAEAFSRLLYGKNLVDEFKDYPLPSHI